MAESGTEADHMVGFFSVPESGSIRVKNPKILCTQVHKNEVRDAFAMYIANTSRQQYPFIRAHDVLVVIASIDAITCILANALVFAYALMQHVML